MDNMAALDALVKAATSKQSPRRGSLIKYATVTVDGPLLDGPVPTLIPGKITAFCSYKIGDRVALIFDGSTPIVLAVVGGGDPDIITITGRVPIASSSTSVSTTPFITVPEMVGRSQPAVVVTPEINPSGIVTVGMAVGYADDGFSIRHRTISGTISNRSLTWVAYIPA